MQHSPWQEQDHVATLDGRDACLRETANSYRTTMHNPRVFPNTRMDRAWAIVCRRALPGVCATAKLRIHNDPRPSLGVWIRGTSATLGSSRRRSAVSAWMLSQPRDGCFATTDATMLYGDPILDDTATPGLDTQLQLVSPSVGAVVRSFLLWLS